MKIKLFNKKLETEIGIEKIINSCSSIEEIKESVQNYTNSNISNLSFSQRTNYSNIFLKEIDECKSIDECKKYVLINISKYFI